MPRFAARSSRAAVRVLVRKEGLQGKHAVTGAVATPAPPGGRAAVDFYVPFELKDDAKRLGARWNWTRKIWFAPTEGVARALAEGGFERMNVEPLADMQGEDRAFGGNTLFVDLIPKSCWFSNARTSIAGKDWQRVRQLVTTRSNHRCECCDGDGEDVHERWDYDEATRKQTLKRLVLLFKACHEATHMGRAELLGRHEAAQAHLQRVCGMTPEQAQEHESAAFALWRQRNASEWELDLSILRDSGIETVAPRRRHGQGEAAKAATLARAGPFREGGGFIRRLARWLVRAALLGRHEAALLGRHEAARAHRQRVCGMADTATTLVHAEPFWEGGLLWQPQSETEWELLAIDLSLVDLSIPRNSGIETVDPRRRHGQGEAD